MPADESKVKDDTSNVPGSQGYWCPIHLTTCEREGCGWWTVTEEDGVPLVGCAVQIIAMRKRRCLHV